jgi:hypothetical protein
MPAVALHLKVAEPYSSHARPQTGRQDTYTVTMFPGDPTPKCRHRNDMFRYPRSVLPHRRRSAMRSPSGPPLLY